MMPSPDVLEERLANLKSSFDEFKTEVRDDLAGVRSDIAEIKKLVGGNASHGWMPQNFREWLIAIMLVASLLTGAGPDVVEQLIGEGLAAPNTEQVGTP